MNRQKKQIFYASLFLFILVVIMLAVYIAVLKPAPSCFDNRQNQNETGIDCGGSCINCELKDGPIKLNFVTVLDKNEFAIILIELRNESVNFGATKFTYQLALKDIDGQGLYEILDDSYIYPAQASKTIIHFINKRENPGVKWIRVSPGASRLTIQSPRWLSKSLIVKPDMAVVNYGVEIVDNTLKVTGRIKNNGNIAVAEADVIVLIKDDQGRLREVGKTFVTNLPAFSEKQFFSLIPYPALIDESDINAQFIIEAR